LRKPVVADATKKELKSEGAIYNSFELSQINRRNTEEVEGRQITGQQRKEVKCRQVKVRNEISEIDIEIIGCRSICVSRS